MIVRLIHRFASHGSILVSVLVAAVVGCEQREGIRSYTVAKETKVEAARPAAKQEPAEATDRMLAAILPAGQQAWFFKTVGPAAAVDKHEKEILDFLAGIRLDENGRAQWQLPPGWREDPAAGMRAATLWIPTDDKPIEISVTTLGWRDTQADVLSNVNRWRGQMQLPEIGAQGLADCTRELAVGDHKMTIADLRGRYEASSMMAPFAGGGNSARSGRPPENSSNALPAGHPPIDSVTGTSSATSAAPAALDVPQFDVPPSWQQRRPSNAMRKAEFGVVDGQQEAVVTLIDFPTDAGPSIAELLPNVNRWRRELGLSEVTADALPGLVEEIEIGAQSASYARLLPAPEKPEESQVDEATLAAMVTSGERVWFVKMTGPRDLVSAQEDQFKAFLKSMRFADRSGATHGNQ
jgi:hypothetical protein